MELFESDEEDDNIQQQQYEFYENKDITTSILPQTHTFSPFPL